MFLQFEKIERPDTLAAQLGDQEKDSQNETEVADAVDDKSLVAGDRIVVIAIPKTDQEIGTETDAFPADEEQQQSCRHHQEQHEKNKEVEINEKAHNPSSCAM